MGRIFVGLPVYQLDAWMREIFTALGRGDDDDAERLIRDYETPRGDGAPRATVLAGALRSVVDLVLARRHAIAVDVVEGIQVHIARSELMAGAIASGADYFLSLDGDVAFTPAVVDALVGAIRGGDVVAAPYRRRTGDGWALRAFVEGRQRMRTVPAAGRVLAIECAPLGCTLIRTAALERMAERYRAELRYVSERDGVERVLLCQPHIVERQGVRRSTQEDFAFCDRARACGLRIEALCDVSVNHAGKTGVLAEALALPP